MSTINRYIWLIDQIRNSGGITLEDLDRRWRISKENDSKCPLNRRTLLRWREKTDEIFGIKITCDKNDEYRYKIEGEETQKDTLLGWLRQNMSLNNILTEYSDLYNNILLENVPSGDVYLEKILYAIKHKKQLSIVYQSFKNSKPNAPAIVNPLCVKLFDKRWYMVAEYAKCAGYRRILALDRIKGLEGLCTGYEMPENFDAKTYFEDFYGVQVEKGNELQKVILRVPASDAPYLRSLPLHHSQHETCVTEQWSIFTLKLKLTYDFTWALLSRSIKTEILEPRELREAVVKCANDIIMTQNSIER